MVCDKCQAKLDTVAAPDPWKDGKTSFLKRFELRDFIVVFLVGSRNAAVGSVGRKLGENKLLAKGNKNPYSNFGKCKLCSEELKIKGFYCQRCAYKKG